MRSQAKIMSTFLSHRRRGFTLVELMITILIIVILMAAMIAALNSARETARKMRTQQLITRLYAHILPRYESYRSRQLPVNPMEIDRLKLNMNAAAASNVQSPRRKIAWFRLWGMRELMRLEMPDSYADIFFTTNVLQLPNATTQNQYDPYSSLSLSYSAVNNMFRDEMAMQAQSNDSFQDLIRRLENRNGPSECLYMIVNTTISDRDLHNVCFSDVDVGDTDNDGMPEFIDGWGNPISFIRWPAGFESELQPIFRYSVNGVVPGSGTGSGSSGGITISSVLGTNHPRSPENSSLYVSRFPIVGAAATNRVVIGAGFHDAFDPYFADRWEPRSSNNGSYADSAKTQLAGPTFPSASYDSPPDPNNLGSNGWGFPQRAYNLFPLIFSNGPDEEEGIALDTPAAIDGNSDVISLSVNPMVNPYGTLTNPYYMFNDTDNEGSANTEEAMRQRGTPTYLGNLDNIHNHHLSAKTGLQ